MLQHTIQAHAALLPIKLDRIIYNILHRTKSKLDLLTPGFLRANHTEGSSPAVQPPE